jgi:hypothetical protein
MGRSDEYRRYAAECLEMASVVHDPKARATLLQMAQVWLRLAGQRGTPERGRKIRSERRVSALLVGLFGEHVPGLSHFLHDLAMPLGLGFSSQAAAFLRKSPVLR